MVEGCNGRSLVRGAVASVEECSHCGSVSMHVGPVSLRLEAHAFRRLAGTLIEAVRRLDEEVEAPDSSGFPIRGGLN